MKQNTRIQTEGPERTLPQLPLDEVVRYGAQRLLQQALEVEVDAYLERYQYIMDDRGRRQVVRNGYRPARRIVTGAGQVEVATPRVDDRVLGRHGEGRFTSQLIPPYLRRTKNIEELIPVLYLKGISTGDFTEALESILGKEVIGLSAENVTRLKRVWQQDYECWSKRDLSENRYVYWWVDGIHFNVRLDSEKQCLLVIIGAREDGIKELLAVEDGYRESKESWLEVLRDLKRRGLKNGPKLVVGDGALGFWAALEEELPDARQQLCWVHKTANVLNKLPQSTQSKAKQMIHDIYLADTREDAEDAWNAFVENYRAKHPKAVACLTDHRDQLLSFYDFPAEHWQHLRSTNVIESTFATVRLRTKRTKGCGTRAATLTMVFKLAESAQKRWRRLRGYRKIADVLRGACFQDGIQVEKTPSASLETVGV